MNSSKSQQQQTSSSTKKQSSNVAQHQQSRAASSINTPSTPNSRKPNNQSRRSQQQANNGGNGNKKRNSPSQMDFLSFQPALQECFQTPQQQVNKRRSSPRTGGNGNVSISQSATKQYSSQVNGYNNSLSPIKLSSPAIAPMIRQGQQHQQSNSARRQQRGSPLSLFKHTPFAGAKYLELPSTKDLPLPPAWLLEGLTATPKTSSSSSEASSSSSSSPISMMEPPSPTTEAAMKVAKENGFDGSIRIHPLQLIAAVSSS
jgi:hypothetical protein